MTAPSDVLRARIADRSARIGVVGLGYVGLPTAVALAEAGFDVVGIDIDSERATAVQEGRSPVEDVRPETVAPLVKEGRLTAVSDHAEAGDLDVVDICVPTPLDTSGDPDMGAILSAVEALRPGLRRGQLIILTSTTYPGTTAEVIQPVLQERGLTVGTDAFLAFAPERIDPGNETFTMRNTPRVVGGATPECTALAIELLETFVDRVVPVSSPAAAEMTKLLENTFRSVNIALANEVAIMCRRLGVDVWEVTEAAATKPYGFMRFLPGPGIGGHCIPVDPTYLSWKLRGLDYTARFIELANDINRRMPEYVVERAAEVLNDDCRSLRGSRVLVLGAAYKADVGDLRQSPAIDIIVLLRERGAEVAYADPHVPTLPLGAEATLAAVEPTPERLRDADLVIVVTAHGAFDWDAVHEHARLVLDTRGRGRGAGWSDWRSI